jgi:hypothetical protein
VQVHDAVAFFQHAGVAVPADCVSFVSTCMEAVQSSHRMDVTRPGALHAALAQAVQELMQEGASPSLVEVRGPHEHDSPSNSLGWWLLAIADFMRALALGYFTSVSGLACLCCRTAACAVPVDGLHHNEQPLY